MDAFHCFDECFRQRDSSGFYALIHIGTLNELAFFLSVIVETVFAFVMRLVRW